MKPIMAMMACAIALSGCVVERQQERMKENLDAVVGTSVASFVATHGPFTSYVKLSDHENSYRWVITGQGVGAIIPVGRALMVAPPQEEICTVILTAYADKPPTELMNWRIRSYQWAGAC